ncbi:FtsX-like permease family protein [candidate division KSB1 bacterium]|nr:FtsX-like permease family protein [candidate division KSB1 bacterium]NIR69572.1 FtsX-like permease family protein [candidate division KSB1 bacterium]NIS25920.1 FtsX-like permease family protein [candidate division KSB1 bacterium]NIT72801.1 FtsX-like permease family protein [candidate division KSB1 bacterium]NIU26608.1 FtsX-like permease family protein [candidate division KSB1 bacterium]
MSYELFVAKRYFNTDQKIPFWLYTLCISLMVIFFPLTIASFFWVVTVESIYNRLRNTFLWRFIPTRILMFALGAILFVIFILSPVILLYLMDQQFSLNWFSRFPFGIFPLNAALFLLFRMVISHVVAGKRHVFASIISFLSIFGICTGVTALIITLSVMNGFESEVRSRIIGFGAHIELRKYHKVAVDDYESIVERIKHINHIAGISPYIDEKALILSASKRNSGVAVKGIDVETIEQVSDIKNDVVYGVFELGRMQTNGQKSYPGIVLGRYLADKLGVMLGDRVQIMSPSGITPLMTRMPPLQTFQVTGFFETGIFEIDEVFAYIAIEEAQRLFRMRGQVTGVEIKLDDLNQADLVASQIRDLLGYPYTAVTWFEMNKNLFSWMQIEKWAAFIILSLIILIAAFNIVNTLIMVVLVKTKEIGILKSMGATSKSIMKIFMFDGLFGGAVGTFLGCALGFALCWSQMKFKFLSLPPDVYIISALPIMMEGMDFVRISVAALALSLIATVYPAFKAAQLEPVEAIRYE